MMKQAQTLPQKSHIVQKGLISLIKNLEENETSNDSYSRDATDALERFALWAGNLGALRAPSSKLSLEHRLAEAPEIRTEIDRQLDYLLEAIDDVATIVQERQAYCDLKEDDKDVEHFDGIGEIQEGPSKEIRMNLELISESLKTLFRIAVLIRKANPDTRFERATHSSRCTFLPTFAIDHVREKYPKLKAKEQSWLAERLGKAIARRRQFIKYCRDHRDRLALDDENIEAESATTVLQSSKATTLLLEKMLSNLTVDEYEDDIISDLSVSTITDSLSTLALPRLVDLSKDGEPFECPICFTLRSIKGERSWRLHAFHDLKPYSCTVGGAECESLAFQDRDSWFQHELDCHRSQYECSLCDYGLFSERAGLKSHILSSHGQFSEHQLQIIEDAGRRAPVRLEAKSCPFCDDWSVALQKTKNPRAQDVETQKVSAPVRQFKRHVGAHLEQLAIFALPRATEDDTGNDRSSVSSIISSHSSRLVYGALGLKQARQARQVQLVQQVEQVHEEAYLEESLSEDGNSQIESKAATDLTGNVETLEPTDGDDALVTYLRNIKLKNRRNIAEVIPVIKTIKKVQESDLRLPSMDELNSNGISFDNKARVKPSKFKFDLSDDSIQPPSSSVLNSNASGNNQLRPGSIDEMLDREREEVLRLLERSSQAAQPAENSDNDAQYISGMEENKLND